MKLAIFDLDNTLLAGDSDYLWGRFLVERGLVDAEAYDRANRDFYAQYKAGTLDIHEFLRFSLRPLTEHPAEALHRLRTEFVDQAIRPIITEAAQALVSNHRDSGHRTLILTATNRFITAPIAELFGVDALLATTPEIRDGWYTGRVIDTPTFREGKITALDGWLVEQNKPVTETWFYSDSLNDLPLLERVDRPFAVDPDDTLQAEAEARNWPILSLRGPAVTDLRTGEPVLGPPA
ncbi:HAD-IB family hydrolase [Methylonatrum kenyense]|uniref:histidinol-phosphatase n=1 Tax=Methylonatrum kenyense TaxID=455253 RepID=UPI0020BDA9FE|nr:HAD family hydrolase [Methylonatrum kenyense]MCK8516151.1 HAD-IB family hydrolase [Methylonatrum kenyense]